MSELTVVIADDEPLAISNLKAKLATYPHLNIVACFDNGDDTLQFLQQQQVDLVFLDIQMPGHKGIEILQLLQKTSAMAPPLLVLVTAYEHYALPAFEHLAFDYLLKPVSRQRLAQCLQDAATALDKYRPAPLATATTQKMLFRTGASSMLLDDGDILQIEAAGNYLCVQTMQQSLVIRETLKELLQRLPGHFVQVHRSTLVNLHHVHQIKPHNNDYLLQLSDGKQVTASRRYKHNWQPLLQSLPQ